MQELIALVKPLSAVTPTAGLAAATAITGSTIDTNGFSGVLILVHFGAIVTGAVTSFKVEHSDNSDMSSNADILGTNQTVTDTDDNKVFFVDIKTPVKRYVRLLVSRATQNATVSAVALPYGPSDAPITQTATGERFVGPASGTA
jgi:hypothetical protein